jgi:histidine triad (HIT) family protein
MTFGGEDRLDCIFCKIVAGELPSYKVYENSSTFAFLDINPISQGHTLVLPKKHVKKLSEAPPDVLSRVTRVLQKVTRAIEDSLNPEGLNIFVNQGEVAGQVIPHLHIHIVPRSKDDMVEFITPKIGLSEKEFLEISRKISNSI